MQRFKNDEPCAKSQLRDVEINKVTFASRF